MKYIRLFCFMWLFFQLANLHAQRAVVLTGSNYPVQIGNNTEILVDSAGKQTETTIVRNTHFTLNHKRVFVSLLPQNNIWIRFVLHNKSNLDKHIVSLQYPNIASIDFFAQDKPNGKLQVVSSTGNSYPFEHREDESVFYNFSVYLPADSVKTYFLHIISNHPVELPVLIHSENSLVSTSLTQTLIMGLYTGLIISILLYNLFLFFAVKDKSYVYYVIYLFFLLLAQLTISGWTFKYLWPSHPGFNRYALLLTSSLTGISAAIFAIAFLHVKSYSKLLYYALMVLLGLYVTSFFSNSASNQNLLLSCISR